MGAPIQNSTCSGEGPSAGRAPGRVSGVRGSTRALGELFWPGVATYMRQKQRHHVKRSVPGFAASRVGAAHGHTAAAGRLHEKQHHSPACSCLGKGGGAAKAAGGAEGDEDEAGGGDGKRVGAQRALPLLADLVGVEEGLGSVPGRVGPCAGASSPSEPRQTCHMHSSAIAQGGSS